MVQSSTSFWADIKKYEDMLAKDPRSYCFAPLAELYRKLGLLDDAINVAMKGCEMHPDYVGGFMALGRAFYEKGLKDESRTALERVVKVTPDNHLAQKLLSQIYMESGDMASAERSLRAILSLYPDDLESQVLLKSLDGGGAAVAEGVGGDLQVETLQADVVDLEHADMIEELTDEVAELEPLDDDLPSDPDNGEGVAVSSCLDEGERKDPLRTATLAELYLSQGMTSAAMDIYRELLKSEPDNREYVKRFAELREILANEARVEANIQQETVLPLGKTTDISAFAVVEEAHAVIGSDAPIVATLERWLENIKGRR